MKTENEIWKDLIALINTALEECEITGWTVRQANQQFKVAPNRPVISISRVSSNRYGFQGRRDKVVNNLPEHEEIYYQQLRFQITFLKKRVTDPTELTSSDVANELATWLMSVKGLKETRALGFMPLRVTDIREPAFVDDSDDFEKSPNFDFLLYLRQNKVSKENAVDAWNCDLIGV